LNKPHTWFRTYGLDGPVLLGKSKIDDLYPVFGKTLCIFAMLYVVMVIWGLAPGELHVVSIVKCNQRLVTLGFRYIPYPGGGEKWGGNGVGDDLYSYGFDGAYLWTGELGRVKVFHTRAHATRKEMLDKEVGLMLSFA